MALTTYGKNELNDHIDGKGSWTPAGVYLVLSTADIAADQSGLAEPANGYARLQTQASDWNVSASGTLTNAADLSFAVATGSWGTIAYFGLAETSVKATEDVYIYAALDSSQAITTDQILTFPAGSLTITAT